MARSQNGGDANIMLQSDICDFANLPAIHAAMERTHGRMIGFQLVAPAQEDDISSLDNGDASSRPRRDSTSRQRPDLGKIPALPRPKFLTAIAEFAFGE
jgi:hypothetical protein